MEPELLDVVLFRDSSSSSSKLKRKGKDKKKTEWEPTVGPDGEQTLQPVGPGETSVDRRKLAEAEFLKNPVLATAEELQERCRNRTKEYSTNGICEVCSGLHRTYVCCENCNYDRHRCHFCGDWLGHDEVSTCYLMELPDAKGPKK